MSIDHNVSYRKDCDQCGRMRELLTTTYNTSDLYRMEFQSALQRHMIAHALQDMAFQLRKLPDSSSEKVR